MGGVQLSDDTSKDEKSDVPWGDNELHSVGSEMLPDQQEMIPLSSGEHPWQEYGMDFRLFLLISQGPGS